VTHLSFLGVYLYTFNTFPLKRRERFFVVCKYQSHFFLILSISKKKQQKSIFRKTLISCITYLFYFNNNKKKNIIEKHKSHFALHISIFFSKKGFRKIKIKDIKYFFLTCITNFLGFEKIRYIRKLILFIYYFFKCITIFFSKKCGHASVHVTLKEK